MANRNSATSIEKASWRPGRRLLARDFSNQRYMPIFPVQSTIKAKIKASEMKASKASQLHHLRSREVNGEELY